MLTVEDNDRLTRVGRGTPMGELMRRYWQPVGLTSELPPDGAPKPIRVLGEDLVLFRDDAGRPGLLGLHCSHRGADLSYGRIENGGLRCLYHGWLYDVDGRCLDQPAEPPQSRFKDKICQLSYPTIERGGLVFGYLGGDQPPLLPDYEFLTVSAEQTATRRLFVDCNYLQKKEGNLDPAHLSFLHRFLEGSEDFSDQELTEEEEADRQRVRIDAQPRIELEDTDFGLRIYAIRNAPDDQKYIRVTNFAYPNLSTHPIGLTGGYNYMWHVPIDDVSTWEFGCIFRRTPFESDAARDEWRQRKWEWENPAGFDPDGRPQRNRSNRYLQDRDELRTKTYTGMGPTHFVHDAFATEGMGPIQDRSRERLGYSDRPIIALRRLLLAALDGDAPHVVRQQDVNDFPEVRSLEAFLPTPTGWQDYRTLLFQTPRGTDASSLSGPTTGGT